jgi:hypothetical protein
LARFAKEKENNLVAAGAVVLLDGIIIQTTGTRHIKIITMACRPGKLNSNMKNILLVAPCATLPCLAQTKTSFHQNIPIRMKNIFFLFGFCLFILAGLSNCASVVHGPVQDITISSQPPGAKIIIDGKVYGTTPQVIQLKRSGKLEGEKTEKKGYAVKLEMDGYAPHETQIKRATDEWVFGNLILGGLIGIIVDASNGSMYKLKPNQVSVPLTKTTTEKTVVQSDTSRNTRTALQEKEVPKTAEVVKKTDGAGEKTTAVAVPDTAKRIQKQRAPLFARSHEKIAAPQSFFGPAFGIGRSREKINYEDLLDERLKYARIYAFGIQYGKQLSEKTGWQVELNLTQHGSRYESVTNTQGVKVTAKEDIRLRYIEVPFLFLYKLPVEVKGFGLELAGGAGLGYMTAARVISRGQGENRNTKVRLKIAETIDLDETSTQERLDAAFLAGLRVVKNYGIGRAFAETRFHAGFLNKLSGNEDAQAENLKEFNRTVLFRAGYQMALK